MRAEEELFADFFQQENRYYIDKVIRTRAGEKYSFNFFAFLFGIFWFIYRKLYVEAAIIFAIIGVVSLLQFAIFHNRVTEAVYNAINFAVNISAAITLGSLANLLYIRKAEKTIRNTDSAYQDEQQVQAVLRRKGGTNFTVLAAVIVIVLIVLIILSKQMPQP